MSVKLMCFRYYHFRVKRLYLLPVLTKYKLKIYFLLSIGLYKKNAGYNTDKTIPDIFPCFSMH